MLHSTLNRMAVVVAILLALGSRTALAEEAHTFCVFDPVGKQGELYQLAQSYLRDVPALAGPTQLRVYIDERIATEDFKAGQCDGLAISSLRARPFNPFVSSIDAVGAVPSREHLSVLIKGLANPKAQAYLEQGPYEVVGVVPLGALYVMVRDREINSVEKAAGKRVAVMDWDRSQAALVQGLAAQPVASDVSSFAPKFNNGQVDIIAAPALLYKQLELERGLAKKGAVYRFPLAQLTATLLVRKDRYPEGFGQRLRALIPGQLDRSYAMIDRAEAQIAPRYWIDLPAADEERYRRLMGDARQQLVEAGYYDPRMLGLLKQVRCRLEPAQAECALAAR